MPVLSPNAICATSSTIIGEYADRVMTVERGHQLGIARSIAHLCADVLNEPLPTEIARLVRYLDPDHETSEQRPAD